MAQENYEIIKCYRQDLPRCRFAGIRYKNSDRVDGGYGVYWQEWFATGKFERLESLLTDEVRAAYGDWDAYIGLEKDDPRDLYGNYEYWIGMFLPADSKIPEDFAYVDLDGGSAGICWIKGDMNSVYMHEMECHKKLVSEGMKIKKEKDGCCYFFERYGCPRFTVPDENGKIILDIGFFVE